MKLLSVIAVFAGSGFGGIFRYITGKWIQSLVPASVFPMGTFVVNVIGCFVIGLLYGLINRGTLSNSELILLLTVGFCGGFTTFSTFINEDFLLFSGSLSQILIAIGYLMASIAAGFLMLYAGYYIAR